MFATCRKERQKHNIGTKKEAISTNFLKYPKIDQIQV